MSYTRDESHVDPYGPATHHEGDGSPRYVTEWQLERVLAGIHRLITDSGLAIERDQGLLDCIERLLERMERAERRIDTLTADIRRAKQAARDAADGLDREVYGA